MLPFVLNALRGLPSAWLLVAASGCADGLAAVVAKLVAEDGSDGRWIAVVLWVALAGGTVVFGVISESSALQRLPATRVAPTVLAMQILIPTVLAPVIGGESWSDTPGGGAVLVVAVGGARRRHLATRKLARGRRNRRRGRGRASAGCPRAS